ncbi:uncharacterized protein PAC_18130 [Phialocephala subalpina]|uniref:Phosphatidylglycerol lysyltransferase C-terminal domain-containing protein n=1 Tax=Phialocephala subalpina TaxID=576137 RepID=A0A1L7XT64_9HELO|nr:uncharacterized protein PAC_18130 [Phialocephala subalpina]
MVSVIGQEPSLQQMPETGKTAKKTKKKSSNRPPPAPEPKLFEQVSHNMVEKLVHDMQVPHDSPTLLDRLRSLGLINVHSSATNTPASTNHSSKAGSGQGFRNTFFDQLSLNPTPGRAANSESSDPASTTSTSKINAKSKATGYTNIFTLGDFAAVDAISMLTDSYGRVSHMGILDGSYSFFVTSALNAALCFKVKDHVCLVGGDPLCPEELFSELLDQFAKFRRKHNWGIIFIGASDTFASYAREQKWTTIQFGNERVLNPVTNPVIQEKTQKRIISQNRQLLNPSKGAITLGIYNPSVLKDSELQAKLVAVYDAWREARNNSGDPQAFITVFDPFAITGLMTYVYTMDRMGTPNGFAALRRIGANNGFHLDPYIAHPSAPRGISDLLVFSSMALLNAAGCTYLSLGYEPLTESGEIFGMPKWIQNLTRKTHKSVYGGLKVSGKKGYYDKWCPDEEQKTGLHLIFPAGTPGVQDIVAVMHFANISIRGLAFAKMKGMVKRQKKEKENAEKEAAKKNPADDPEKTTAQRGRGEWG